MKPARHAYKRQMIGFPFPVPIRQFRYPQGANINMEPSDPLSRSLLQSIQHTSPQARLFIAFSGGMDSHVLLHLAHALQAGYPQNLHAVHVHHGLQAQADAWVQHCTSVCETLNMDLQICRVQVPTTHGESPEAAAREARYTALADLLRPGDAVLTAQHADDQAETLLLQLLRGAGTAGLAAMPVCASLGRGLLLRPLLLHKRDELQAYAKQYGLDWVEDPSNADRRFARNYLRHEIMPRLQKHWPASSRTLSRAAKHQAQTAALLKEIGTMDWQNAARPVTLAGNTLQALCRDRLAALSTCRRANALRGWIKHCGLPLPAETHWQQAEQQFFQHKPQSETCVAWAGAELRVYRNMLFALTPLPVPQFKAMAWQGQTQTLLPWGILQTKETQGRGLCASKKRYTVDLYRPGMQCRLRGHRRQLKKLFQEYALPPWLRGLQPVLLDAQGEIAALPGIGICDGFRAKDGEAAWDVNWRWHCPPETSAVNPCRSMADNAAKR